MRRIYFFIALLGVTWSLLFWPGILSQDILGSIEIHFGLQPSSNVIPIFYHQIVSMFIGGNPPKLYLHLFQVGFYFCSWAFWCHCFFPIIKSKYLRNFIFLIGAYPANILLMNNLDKDVIFGILNINYTLLGILLLRQVEPSEGKQEVLKNIIKFLYLIAGFLLCLVRHNGFAMVVVLSSFILFTLIKKKEFNSQWKFSFLLLVQILFGSAINSWYAKIWGIDGDYFSKRFTWDHLLIHDYLATLKIKHKKNFLTDEDLVFLRENIVGFNDIKTFRFDSYNSDDTRNLEFFDQTLGRQELSKRAFSFLINHPVEWLNTKRHYINALITSNYSDGVVRVHPKVSINGTNSKLSEGPFQHNSDNYFKKIQSGIYWFLGHTIDDRLNHFLSYYIWNFKPLFRIEFLIFLVFLYLQRNDKIVALRKLFWEGEIALLFWAQASLWVPFFIISGYNHYKYFWSSIPLGVFFIALMIEEAKKYHGKNLTSL